MKKIFLICIILFLLVWNSLSSDSFPQFEDNPNYYQADFISYNENVLIDHDYRYSLPFFRSNTSLWTFENQTFFRRSRNFRFDRESRTVHSRWNFSYVDNSFLNRAITNSLYVDYHCAQDDAKPQDGYYSIRKKTQTLGYNVVIPLGNHIFFKNDASYLFRKDKESSDTVLEVDDSGYRNSSSIIFERDGPISKNNLNLFGNYMSLDYDWKREYGLNSVNNISFLKDGSIGSENWGINEISLRNYSSFNRFDRKIFVLYEMTDRQTRSEYSMDNQLGIVLNTGAEIHINNVNRFLDNSMTASTFRIFSEWDNRFSLSTKIPIDPIEVNLKGETGKVDKNYSEGFNSRKIERKSLTVKLSYYITHSDSLVYVNDTGLNQTFYNDPEVKLDNDQFYQNNSITFYINSFETILFSTIFSLNTRQEIFIDSMMSASNKKKESYNIIPRLTIFLHNNLKLLQEYHLRADYDKFEWKEKFNDRLYRMFSADYRWEYSSGGFLYKKHNEPNFGVFLSYRYLHNNTGDYIDDKYYIYTENKYHKTELGLTISKSGHRFVFNPTVSWHSQTEISQVVELSYRLSELSFLDLVVNPYWYELDNIKWRINCSFSYYF